MSLLYKAYSVLVLGLFHVFNFQLCKGFIRPKLLPILITTNETKLVNSINLNLKELGLEKQKISIEAIKECEGDGERGECELGIWDLNNFKFNTLFDLFNSFSLQLIGLFLLDIIHVTDFEIRHFDWYITLFILIVGLIYVIPSYLIHCYIYEDNNYLTKYEKIIRFFIISTIWVISIYLLYLITILNEIEGNLIQISLYLLSLFGVCCLSILNGMGCIMGCFDLKRYITGEEKEILNNKEIELSIELKNLEFLIFQEQETSFKNNKIFNQLIRIESILREILNNQESDKGVYFLIKFSTWIYCIYKVIYGVIRNFQILLLNGNESNGSGDVSGDGKDFYHGSGDFLSISIARVIIYVFFNNEPNYELLDKITMIINFVISVNFFIFSIQNVLLTFKNLRNLSNQIIEIDEYEIKTKRFTKHISKRITNKFSNKMKSMFIYEITGIYIVSTALLLNSTNMPIHLSKFLIDEEDWKIEKLVLNNSIIEIEFINNWFDKWFGFGSLSTILILIILEKYQRIEYSSGDV